MRAGASSEHEHRAVEPRASGVSSSSSSPTRATNLSGEQRVTDGEQWLLGLLLMQRAAARGSSPPSCTGSGHRWAPFLLRAASTAALPASLPASTRAGATGASCRAPV
ncbi:hypothetical protein Dimus_038035 [Dionaea muscipula]